ncbi:MAG: transcriptional regulator, LuxR family [Thermoleophilia bacterium]|nr:transcriptional regulator, LuxR family [Thermoleophilia bacterium]
MTTTETASEGTSEGEPPLVERARLLEQWDDLRAATVADGSGRLLLWEGRPGAGKSRLAAEALERAAADGWKVLRAAGGELESQHDFTVVRQALALRDAHDPEVHPGDEAALLHDAFWTLADLTDGGPVALLVDDAHWADALSLAWLAHVARRLDELPIVVLLTARPGGPASIDRLALSGVRVAVERLSVAGARSLVEWQWPDREPTVAFVEACHSATGGTPFLLLELLRALRAAGIEPDDAGATHAVEVTPERVRAWVAVRLDGLGAEACALAQAAALLEPGSPLARIARVADVAQASALPLAGVLAREAILRPPPDTHLVHPLVRAAVRCTIDASALDAMRRRTSDALAQEHATADQVALPLVDAVPSADRVVLDRLVAGAVRALERGLPDLEVRLLERAEREGCPLEAPERAALLRMLGAAVARTGGDGADRWFLAAAEVEPDAVLRARDSLSLGRARFARGEFEAALEAFAVGQAVSEGVGDVELDLELEAGWASSVVFTPLAREPDSQARLRRLVSRSGQPATSAERIAMAHMAGLEMLMAGNAASTRELVDAAWGGGALLAAAGPEEPALWAVTAAAFGLGDLDLVVEVADATEAAATHLGAPLARAAACCVRSFARYQRGELAACIEDCEVSLRLGSTADGTNRGTFLPVAVGTLARALLATGDLAAARAMVDLDADHEAVWSRQLTFVPILAARAELLQAGGDASGALEAWLSVGAHERGLIGRDLNSAYMGGWRFGAVDALLALGRRGEAGELADEELAASQAWGQARGVARATRARATVDGPAGLEDLERAVAQFAAAGLRLDEAAARIAHGAQLRAAGRRTDALAVLREGLDRADRIGARVLADRAREELLVLGARPRRQRTAGVAALTATERRVAMLVAEGRTNREVAEHLVVTMHAIRYHLRNVYAKLGLSERDGLAEALRSGGAVDE